MKHKIGPTDIERLSNTIKKINICADVSNMLDLTTEQEAKSLTMNVTCTGVVTYTIQYYKKGVLLQSYKEIYFTDAVKIYNSF